jgi:Rod binding domain-containing protein
MPLYVNPLANQPLRTDDLQALQKQKEQVATKELEKLFASMLIKEMQKSVKDNGLFGSGPDTELYQDFLTESMADAIAEGGHFGIAEMTQAQLRRDGLLPPESKTADLGAFTSKEFPLHSR